MHSAPQGGNIERVRAEELGAANVVVVPGLVAEEGSEKREVVRGRTNSGPPALVGLGGVPLAIVFVPRDRCQGC